MATHTAQRVGIWVIAVVLTIGTLAGFVAIILAPKNQQVDQDKLQQLTAEYQTLTDEYQKNVAAQGTILSDQYYNEFSQYSSHPAAFDAASVTELQTKDLKIGDGDDITNESSFTAYYIGWNPSGVVFDQSIADSALKAPFTAQPGGVIEGWTEGVNGMKVGGVREVTIPSEKAYAAAGSGENIPPNTPLKFIIMIIPTPKPIAQPEVPQELLDYYSRGSF